MKEEAKPAMKEGERKPSTAFAATDVHGRDSSTRLAFLQHEMTLMEHKSGGRWDSKRDSTARAISLLSKTGDE